MNITELVNRPAAGNHAFDSELLSQLHDFAMDPCNLDEDRQAAVNRLNEVMGLDACTLDTYLNEMIAAGVGG